jgi:hypothetical protein
MIKKKKFFFFVTIECWDGNPDNRPFINEVVERLNTMIYQQDENINEKTDEITNQMTNQVTNQMTNQMTNQYVVLNNDGESVRGESCQISFQNILPEIDLGIKVNEITEFIMKDLNKRLELPLTYKVLDYIDNQNIKPQEIYDWLCNNQNYNSNSSFLLGIFNYYGIATSEDCGKAFNLFMNASNQGHIMAQFFAGRCYGFGFGTKRNEELAFEYYKKVADKDCAMGQLYFGWCYDYDYGICKKDPKLAFYWYEKSANNGNIRAMYNLGHCYKEGHGIEKDIDKAIYWYKKSAEKGYESSEIELKKLINNK